MEPLPMKRGKIETIGEDRITILNLDGFCRDNLTVTPGKAIYIRDKFGVDEEVLYSVKDGKLIFMWVDKVVLEPGNLYDAIPKEIECTGPT